ncbi:helix-turn-helix transcriptional regulator [Psychromarinibacter sp. S121]|uniref:helix-turn-helix transcriptional regulator n=1 Tax=Psychromarinibacter sp. S121 TaxID=3415127 RepID=UPI003C7D106F
MLRNPMASLAHQIDACLAQLGTERFPQAFCDLVEAMEVDQIMVFSLRADHASCLLSRHFRHAALAEKLATQYLDRWFLKDPLLADLLAAAPGTVAVRRLEDVQADMDAVYRRIFFDEPGLTAKTTLLAAGDSLRLFVSLYRSKRGPDGPAPDLARLVGRLALLHFEKAADTGIPPPLAVLSTREQAVCLGILAGQKAESIAADLGVAPSTVVTYRKRAYEKLGLTSRAGLFAICRD